MPAAPENTFSEASADVLIQADAIETVLRESGHTPRRIPFTKDVRNAVQRLTEENVEVVFNLCETVDEDPALVAHPAAVFELLGIPFSGSPSLALALTTDKVVTKRILEGCGINTPKCVLYKGGTRCESTVLRFPVIVKPRYQDASIGIDQDSVFADKTELDKNLERMFLQHGDLLVEEYIDGREFNISLFGYPTPRVLPLAEIDFTGFPDGLHRIVGYRAKWDTSSLEYRHTHRRFPRGIPASLRLDMERTALACFRVFMLRDYGRVDLRVDRDGKVHVLEINANCCLSPDAGFPAALRQAGVDYRDMVNQLLHFILQRSIVYGHQARSASRQG